MKLTFEVICEAGICEETCPFSIIAGWGRMCTLFNKSLNRLPGPGLSYEGKFYCVGNCKKGAENVV